MAGAYANSDGDVVDYEIFCLDLNVIDRQTNSALLIRGPKPQNLERGRYFACVGAAQTFGRFCHAPFPTLLQQRLGIPTLNLGRGGAGPSFFSKGNEKLLDYINGGMFAIIQVMSGRSASSSLFESKGLGYYIRRSDGVSIECDEAFRQLLEKNDEAYARTIVAETRHNWVNDYIELLETITIPKILFWFSERPPRYRERYSDVYALFGAFPQLVNGEMINEVNKHSHEYVECVSKQGVPHALSSRFTGKPITVTDQWGGSWSENWYYPSPEMHVCAANALEQTCRRYTLGAGSFKLVGP